MKKARTIMTVGGWLAETCVTIWSGSSIRPGRKGVYPCPMGQALPSAGCAPQGPKVILLLLGTLISNPLGATGTNMLISFRYREKNRSLTKLAFFLSACTRVCNISLHVCFACAGSCRSCALKCALKDLLRLRWLDASVAAQGQLAPGPSA